MKEEIAFDPDNIPFTDEELKRTTILHGHDEIEAARKIRRAKWEYNLSITQLVNTAFAPDYDPAIIPDDYDLPILTDVEARNFVKLDPEFNKVILNSSIAIRRKLVKDWEITQSTNRCARFERDNYHYDE